MNDEQLTELLQRADDATPSPTVEAGLTSRVHRRARARRQRRIVSIASALLVALIGGVVWSGRHWPGAARTIAVQQPAETQAKHVIPVPLRDQLELAQLDQDARLHEKIASAMLRAEPKVSQPRSVDDIIVASQIVAALAENRERAAHTMIERGDQLLAESHDSAEAATSYRRVLQLFPKSAQAQTARRRLENIGA